MKDAHTQNDTIAMTDTNQETFLNAEWLANISHELRSPLTAIQGYTHALLHYGPRISQQEQTEFLQIIQESCQTMNTALDYLLDIAQLEAGTIKPHLTSIHLLQLIQSILSFFQQKSTHHLSLHRQPIVDVDNQPSEEITKANQTAFIIQADRMLLQKVLFHLFDNALKYAPENTNIDIILSKWETLPSTPPQAYLFVEDPHQPYFKICIQDQGIAISCNEQRRIFERFYRCNTDLNRSVTGLGIGLTICKYIVKLHHGAIWVENNADHGNTFCILLPANLQKTVIE